VDYSCGVSIKWRKPDDRGAYIKRYIVKIQNNQASFVELEEFYFLETDGSIESVIQMETLTRAPFFLSVGDLVKVQVSAENEKGISLPSRVNSNDCLVDVVPGTAQSPRELYTTDDSITITWGNAAERNGSPITGYIIEW
jgi:hypothetical protein